MGGAASPSLGYGSRCRPHGSVTGVVAVRRWAARGAWLPPPGPLGRGGRRLPACCRSAVVERDHSPAACRRLPTGSSPRSSQCVRQSRRATDGERRMIYKTNITLDGRVRVKSSDGGGISRALIRRKELFDGNTCHRRKALPKWKQEVFWCTSSSRPAVCRSVQRHERPQALSLLEGLP